MQAGARTLVACGQSGVWVVEFDELAGDRLIQTQRVEGSAVGVFSRGGRIWVELEVRSARPLELTPNGPSPGELTGQVTAPEVLPRSPSAERAAPMGAPKAPPAQASAASASLEMTITGRVLSSEGGQVVVDLGREHDIEVGRRIEFSVETYDQSPLGRFKRRDVIAVGRVSSVTESQSLVELGLGEAVPIGAEATLSSRSLTSSRSAPPRATGIWTLAGVLRPFFVLEELGVGALNEFSLAYQSEGPLRYALELSPFAFASAGDGTTFAALAVGVISYDTRLFEIGLGVGAQTVNDGDFEPGSGLSVAQSLRFGARDGLSLHLRNDVSLFHSEFDYSAFTGLAQIPVADRGWMVLQGGGGTVGYGFFEVGGKVLLVGNGTRHSLFLRGTIGYAALFETGAFNEVQFTPGSFAFGGSDLYYGGPLLGFGMEWRQ